MEANLDRIDLKILTCLQEDGRISNLKLAEAVALSPTAVLARVQRLTKDGYILGYEARLNPLKLGAGMMVFAIQKREKVAIVGCAESKLMAPFQLSNEWEFWGVNNLHLTLPKAPWTRWFELHSIAFDNIKYLRRGQPDFRGQPIQAYLESLNALNIPVYMQKPWNVIPNAVPYPLQVILKEFPRRYFTNTISWMISLAILEGFKEIGIYGVDMAVSSPLRQQNEYSHQRPSCEYFIGLAEGRGIKVHLPDECDLLKSRFLYAIEDVQETAFNKKLIDMKKSMQNRLNEADNKERIANKQREQYIGAISAIQEIEKIWGNE